MIAHDRDEGNNSAIVYSLLEMTEAHSPWFQINQRTGLITTRAHIDCETDPVPKLMVIAKDNGSPQLSSTATLLVTIHDTNDNEPVFDQSFYNATVTEEKEAKGRCILKVSHAESIYIYSIYAVVVRRCRRFSANFCIHLCAFLFYTFLRCLRFHCAVS